MEIWWEIGEDVLKKLVDSMPDRAQALFKSWRLVHGILIHSSLSHIYIESAKS